VIETIEWLNRRCLSVSGKPGYDVATFGCQPSLVATLRAVASDVKNFSRQFFASEYTEISNE
jgi:hypothetical protein